MAKRRMERLGRDIHQNGVGYFASCDSCGWWGRAHATYHSACMSKASHRCPPEVVRARVDAKIAAQGDR